MNAHIHARIQVQMHLDHNHDGPFSRIARNLEVANDWLAGPSMSDRERASRKLAEARNSRYESLML